MARADLLFVRTDTRINSASGFAIQDDLFGDVEVEVLELDDQFHQLVGPLFSGGGDGQCQEAERGQQDLDLREGVHGGRGAGDGKRGDRSFNLPDWVVDRTPLTTS